MSQKHASVEQHPSDTGAKILLWVGWTNKNMHKTVCRDIHLIGSVIQTHVLQLENVWYFTPFFSKPLLCSQLRSPVTTYFHYFTMPVTRATALRWKVKWDKAEKWVNSTYFD